MVIFEHTLGKEIVFKGRPDSEASLYDELS